MTGFFLLAKLDLMKKILRVILVGFASLFLTTGSLFPAAASPAAAEEEVREEGVGDQ